MRFVHLVGGHGVDTLHPLDDCVLNPYLPGREIDTPQVQVENTEADARGFGEAGVDPGSEGKQKRLCARSCCSSG